MENNFNLIAPVYDGLSRLVFGPAIINSQTWLLEFIPDQSKILVIGGGSGIILEELLKTKTNCQILYLEASEKMLELSRKRYEKMPENCQNTVEFRLGTQHDLTVTENFDVIFTGFFLDLFQPEALLRLMQQLFIHLKPGGSWLLADFAPENASLFWQKSLLQSMVWFFKITANLQANKLPELPRFFQQLPATLQAETYFYRRLIRSAVYRKEV